MQKNMEVLERVQRRATRMMGECRGLEYEDRLRIAKFTTLEIMRKRVDFCGGVQDSEWIGKYGGAGFCGKEQGCEKQGNQGAHNEIV